LSRVTHDLPQVLLNGQPLQGVSATDWTGDRGLHFGDGLFETMLVQQGRIRFQALHALRLAEGCRRLGIPLDHTAVWQGATAFAADYREATLKLLVTRGIATARGYTPSGKESPQWLLFALAAPGGAEVPQHVRVRSLQAGLGENPLLAGIKHCNRLEQVLARVELKNTGCFEGLMCSSSGRLISGTMSNIFIERGDELITPVLDHCGIAGVTRAVVLREAAASGFTLRIADVSPQLLPDIDGLLITNARMGVVPVHELDGRPLRVSTRILDLAAQVNALVD
jgi:4-amino-4-deoxychorismate lyase